MVSMRCRLAAVLLGSLALAGLPAAAGSSEIDKAGDYAARGMEELEAGRDRRAEQLFRKALRLVPEFPDAHMGLGHLATRSGDLEQALDEFRQARDGYDRLGERLLAGMRLRYQEQRTRIPELQQQLNLIRSGEIRLGDEERRMRIADLELAIRDLETMTEPTAETAVEPPGEVYFRIGSTLARLGRWEEAATALEHCIQRSPGFAQAFNNLALAYWRTGRHDLALRSLDQAEALGLPPNPRFRADIERSR